ncbi:MAG: 23S rRNA (guanosine(2251)-2'-O)-methyltransferase RlmB [Acidobacteriota bacterium]
MLSRLHPIAEAVRSRPREIEWVLFDKARKDRRINELLTLCRRAGVSVRFGDRAALERLAGPSQQGAAARVAMRGYLPEEEALAGTPGRRFLLVLDEVEDPHNLGAVLRVADGAGARVVVPERGSAPLSETVARTSAGALERVPVVRVGNLRRFLDHLKTEGFQVVGMDVAGEPIYDIDLTGDLALVLGGEAKGMRRLVREGCDRLARLPMRGELASLNVSTAASAAAWEVIRQRDFSSEKP